jgi:Asp-tRNA(Asn)/Glu-tRNA(Gln) amidotransferase A subunit family amidase
MLERLSLSEMAALVRRGEVSPVDLVNDHLARIDQVNPHQNAFFRIFREEARADALRLAALPPMGPLYGVPITLKNSFEIRGIPVTAGSRLVQRTSDKDATAVARLRNAGAIFLGQTNVPDLLSSYETDNDVCGRTLNPWDDARTPGGSSGGEAAAIASFCSAGGLGGDGGGSIRIPAHFCGIAGFKPTHRRIGAGGGFPPSLPPAGLMETPGPMARSVADLRLLFHVMQGEDDRDSLSVPLSADMVQGVPKVGIWRRFYKVPVHPSIEAAVERAAQALRQCGFEAEDVEIQGLERAPNVWAFFFGELRSVVLRDLLAGRESEAHWTLTETLRPDGPVADARTIAAQFAERERLRTLVLEQMAGRRVLLMPPCSIPAFRHGERRYDLGGGLTVSQFPAMALATIWNLFGFPALVIPFGRTEDGMPVGVQLVGRPFEDELLLEIGERLEEARGPFTALPR